MKTSLTVLTFLALSSPALAACATAPVSTANATNASTETAAALPASWDEFARLFVMQGGLGTWTSSGTTKDMWVGIPAGLKYTHTGFTRFAGDGKSIVGSHTMLLEDGRVLSTGTQVTTWDSETGKAIATNSGFDMGKPYTGVSTLKAMDETSITWEYVEQSRGKTTTYETGYKRVGPTTQEHFVRQLPDGKAWTTTHVRRTPLDGVLARWNVVGTWEMAMPDGSKAVAINTVGLDGHVVMTAEQSVAADGTRTDTGGGAMWWDAGTDTVRFHWMNVEGMSVMGEMISLTSDGAKTTMVSRHEGFDGDGEAVAATLTRVLEGDTMTTTFSDFRSEGMPMTPAWVGVPMTSTRVK